MLFGHGNVYLDLMHRPDAEHITCGRKNLISYQLDAITKDLAKFRVEANILAQKEKEKYFENFQTFEGCKQHFLNLTSDGESYPVSSPKRLDRSAII